VLLATTALGSGSFLLIYRSVAEEHQVPNPIASHSASSPDNQGAVQGKARENRHKSKEDKEDNAETREAQAREAQAKEAQAKEAEAKEAQAKEAEAKEAKTK
jgi:hypothetical protein